MEQLKKMALKEAEILTDKEKKIVECIGESQTLTKSCGGEDNGLQ